MFRLLEVCALGAWTVSSASCPDGYQLPSVHLQFAAFVDMAAFDHDDKWYQYRQALKTAVVQDLVAEFGEWTEAELYSYTNKPIPNEEPLADSWCAKRGPGFALAKDMRATFDELFDTYNYSLPRPITDDRGLKHYSSYNDNLYHSLMAGDWNRNELDDHQRPIIRVLHTATDVIPWSHSNPMYNGIFPVMTVDVAKTTTNPGDYCSSYDYPHDPEVDDALSCPEKMFLSFLSDNNVPNPDATNLQEYLRKKMICNTDCDVRKKGCSETLPTSGMESWIVAGARFAACEYFGHGDNACQPIASPSISDPCSSDQFVQLVGCTNQPDCTAT